MRRLARNVREVFDVLCWPLLTQTWAVIAPRPRPESEADPI